MSGVVGGGATSLGLGDPQAPALSTLSGAPPAGLPKFNNMPQTELVQRTGHPRRLPDRSGGTRACAHGPPVCAGNDAPEAATLSSRSTKSGGGRAVGTGGGRGNNKGSGGRRADSSGTGLRCGGDPAPPARVQSVHSRSERPGDDVFLDGSVTFMACSARVEFSSTPTAAVVAKASALITSVKRTSLHPPELLSYRQAWSKYTFYTTYVPGTRFEKFGVLAPPCVDSRNTCHRTPLPSRCPRSKPLVHAGLAIAAATVFLDRAAEE